MKNRSRWARTSEIDILEKMNKKLMTYEVHCVMELLDVYQYDSKRECRCGYDCGRTKNCNQCISEWLNEEEGRHYAYRGDKWDKEEL